MIYVDESGVQKEMNPLRGRAKRGVKLYQETSGKRIKRDNVIAGYLNGLIREYINKCVNVESPQTASAIFSRYLANIHTVCMSKMAVYSPNIGNNDDDTVMMQYAV